MGLLTDILKEIPQAAVLKEKIASIEAKYAAADTENAILKDDLRHAQAEITELKKQVEKLTHIDDSLHENERLILIAVAELDDEAYSHRIASRVQLHEQRVIFHLDKLVDIGYVDCVGLGGPPLYYLQPKGRKYLIDQGVF